MRSKLLLTLDGSCPQLAGGLTRPRGQVAHAKILLYRRAHAHPPAQHYAWSRGPLCTGSTRALGSTGQTTVLLVSFGCTEIQKSGRIRGENGPRHANLPRSAGRHQCTQLHQHAADGYPCGSHLRWVDEAVSLGVCNRSHATISASTLGLQAAVNPLRLLAGRRNLCREAAQRVGAPRAAARPLWPARLHTTRSATCCLFDR